MWQLAKAMAEASPPAADLQPSGARLLEPGDLRGWEVAWWLIWAWQCKA